MLWQLGKKKRSMDALVQLHMDAGLLEGSQGSVHFNEPQLHAIRPSPQGSAPLADERSQSGGTDHPSHGPVLNTSHKKKAKTRDLIVENYACNASNKSVMKWNLVSLVEPSVNKPYILLMPKIGSNLLPALERWLFWRAETSRGHATMSSVSLCPVRLPPPFHHRKGICRRVCERHWHSTNPERERENSGDFTCG